MGEAKRRNAEGRRLADELGRRLRAGDFGPAGAERYLLVLDKSAQGRELLARLRGAELLPGLHALLEAEPFRLWEASALFGFVVLTSGSGSPERRSLLASSLERLVEETLPRAWRRMAVSPGGPVGLICGLEAAAQQEVEAALRRLRG